MHQRQQDAKRQAAKAGIGFEALDNGFAAVADTEAVQAICDGLTEQKIDALLHKWLARIPHPYTPQDRAAGYRYAVSVLQAEFSLTQMLDQPVSGRVFFEQVIRDNLDLGRPDRVQLVFDRRIHRGRKRPTPSRFRSGDHPARHAEPVCRLQAHHNQAVPQGRTSAADRDHDQRHLRLQHRQAADQSARPAEDRLLSQPTPPRRSTTQPRPRRWHHHAHRDHRTRAHRDRATRGRYAFTDDRVQALFSVLCIFRLLPRGFTNRDLREHLEPLLDVLRGPSAAGREPTTCAGCDTTASSNGSRTATATASPPRATVEPCSCPGRITGFSATDSPKSPQTNQPRKTPAADRAYEAALDDLLTGPRSPHEQHSNLTHPQRQTRLKSSSRRPRRRAGVVPLGEMAQPLLRDPDADPVRDLQPPGRDHLHHPVRMSEVDLPTKAEPPLAEGASTIPLRSVGRLICVNVGVIIHAPRAQTPLRQGR